MHRRSGCKHPTSLPISEAPPNVEEYLVSNSVDLSLWDCGGSDCEHPASLLTQETTTTVDYCLVRNFTDLPLQVCC